MWTSDSCVAVVMGMCCTLAFGVVPAFTFSSRGIADSIRATSRTVSKVGSISSVVVTAEVALTTVLPVTGSLFGVSLKRLMDVEPGFDPVAYLVPALLLMVLAPGASYLPARKATQMEPVEALRAQ